MCALLGAQSEAHSSCPARHAKSRKQVCALIALQPLDGRRLPESRNGETQVGAPMAASAPLFGRRATSATADASSQRTRWARSCWSSVAALRQPNFTNPEFPALWSAIQPIQQCLGDPLRLLQRCAMPRSGDLHEARTAYSVSKLRRLVGRDDGIGLAGEDERRA